MKAVVDAYTGQVTLYSWNQESQPDPVLQTWESAFPGLVQPESSIPSALLPHLRYPQDLFDVQRSLLTQYHVADPSDFYNGADFWKVPTDPTVAAAKTLNGGGAGGSSPTLPSTYMSLSPTGDGPAQWALSSPMVTLNYRELAGFLTVNAQPGPDYGKFTLLDFPAGQSVESPAQIQNDIESDNQIASALTLLRGNSKVVLGNLLHHPAGQQGALRRAGVHPGAGHEHVPDPAPRDRGLRQRRAGVQAHPERRPPPGDRQRRRTRADRPGAGQMASMIDARRSSYSASVIRPWSRSAASSVNRSAVDFGSGAGPGSGDVVTVGASGAGAPWGGRRLAAR